MCYWCKIKYIDFVTANVGTKKTRTISFNKTPV